MQTYLTLKPSGQPDLVNLTEHEIRAAHPNTSFPSPLRPEDIAGMGYTPIRPEQAPLHSPHTHRTVLDAPERNPSANDGQGAWVQVWRIEPLPDDVVAQRLTQRKAALVQRIDAEADAFITQLVGPRSTEYELAYQDACTLTDADYKGPVPTYVHADMEAYGRTAQQSCQLIISKYVAWQNTLAKLRQTRLAAKARAERSATHEDVDDYEVFWQLALDDLRKAP